VLDALLLTDIHATWGLAGWVIVMTATVPFSGDCSKPCWRGPQVCCWWWLVAAGA
jgi:hypothetical protein